MNLYRFLLPLLSINCLLYSTAYVVTRKDIPVDISKARAMIRVEIVPGRKGLDAQNLDAKGIGLMKTELSSRPSLKEGVDFTFATFESHYPKDTADEVYRHAVLQLIEKIGTAEAQRLIAMTLNFYPLYDIAHGLGCEDASLYALAQAIYAIYEVNFVKPNREHRGKKHTEKVLPIVFKAFVGGQAFAYETRRFFAVLQEVLDTLDMVSDSTTANNSKVIHD